MKVISFKILSVVSLLFIATAASAQTDTITDNEGNFYSGVFVGKGFTGEGVCEYANGSKYTGNWKNGFYDGKGTYTDTDGSKYSGEWKNGLRSGKGVMNHSDKEKYDGEWRSDNMYGYGSWFDKSGKLKYKGEWINNKYNGSGTLYDDNGDIYEGTFSYGNFTNGKLTSTMGGRKYVYEGKFTDDDITEGSIIYPDESTYEGKIKYKMPSGYGTKVKRSNGNYIYTYKGYFTEEGEFSNGEIVYATGDKYKGTFIDNRYNYGVLTKLYGDYYDGNFDVNNAFKSGKVKTTIGYGKQYEGDYTNYAYTGQATIRYSNGEKYIGAVVNGQKEGYGILILKSRHEVSGTWKNDAKYKTKKRYNFEYTINDGGHYIGVSYVGFPINVAWNTHQFYCEYSYLWRYLNAGTGIGFLSQNEYLTATGKLSELKDYLSFAAQFNGGVNVEILGHIILKCNYEFGVFPAHKDKVGGIFSEEKVKFKTVLSHSVQPEIMLRYKEGAIGVFYKFSYYQDSNSADNHPNITSLTPLKTTHLIGVRLGILTK